MLKEIYTTTLSEERKGGHSRGGPMVARDVQEVALYKYELTVTSARLNDRDQFDSWNEITSELTQCPLSPSVKSKRIWKKNGNDY